MSSDYLGLLTAVAPVFLVIVAGYVIRTIGWLTEDADASLMRVIVNFLYPCLIVDTMLGNPAMQNVANLLLAPLIGFGTIVLGFALSFATARLLALGDDRIQRTFAFTTGMYNYGYVPLPLVQKLFDAPTTAVLFVHNVGVEIALWTAGVGLMSGKERTARRGWHHVFNAPVLAIVAAILLHFAGAHRWLPEIAMSAVHNIGITAIPLGLLLSGATFADQMKRRMPDRNTRVAMAAALLRLGLLPALMLLLARWLPAPVELRRIIVIQAAMPCAVMPVILAKHYGGDSATAMRIVLVTSTLALLTIPLWLQLGFRFALGGGK